ncbi:hypothetical protein ACET3Z_013902 [Daucus carota]
MALQNMPSARSVLSVIAPLAASAVLLRSITSDFVPDELNTYVSSKLYRIFKYFSSEFTIVIEEFRGLSLDKNEEVFDSFEDLEVKWKLISTEVKSSGHGGAGSHLRDLNATLRSEVRWYELSFHKKHRAKVVTAYLTHVLETSKAIKEETKAIKIRTAEYDNWDSEGTNLDHPMTFKNLALDSKLKNEIIEDLERFKNGKDFYRRTGRAWKRGYLLYGPPGTGKSSLVASMANYLNFDIYDLDLTEVTNNSDLRRLLLSLSSRSILVIEDIDCSIKLQNRNSKDEPEVTKEDKVTLSGLLNFIDGLWSCCGEERIIVFTTNHVEKLDPALLRPGRMDMHILMSYCTFSAFKQLAFNYLGILQHPCFTQIEELLQRADLTPAEIAGELMKSTDPEVSIHGLLSFLKHKVAEQSTGKTEAEACSVQKPLNGLGQQIECQSIL